MRTVFGRTTFAATATIICLVSLVPAVANVSLCQRVLAPGPGFLGTVNCVSLGPIAPCDGDCGCKKIIRGVFTDCHCEKIEPPPPFNWCGSLGRWSLTADGPLNSGESVLFSTTPDPADTLLVFDYADVDANGDILAVGTQLTSGQFGGFAVLSVGVGPSEAIPVTITEMEATSISFSFMGIPTGTNTLTASPETSTIQGIYNSIAGTIQFDTPVPCVLTNSIVPGGTEMFVRPLLVSQGGNSWVAVPSAAGLVAQNVPLLTISTFVGMTMVLMIAGLTLMWRRRRLRVAT